MIEDFTKKSDIKDDLTANSSLLNDFEYTDNIDFDQEYEGVYPQNMPLGASQLISQTGEPTIYKVQAKGYFSYGDGTDGDTTISADTNLTSDKYYDNLTINATKILNPSGYRIFVAGNLIVNGTIARNGNNGINGETYDTRLGGAGGTVLADGYLKGALAGGAGGDGGVATQPGSAGSAGVNTSNSIGSNGANGGNGGGANGGIGGTGGTATASNVKLIANWHLATLLDIGSTGTPVKFDNSASSGGGGGGGGTAGGAGGGGGGAGSGGGIVAIYAKKIIINSGGSITANGGNGGNGGAANSGNGGGGGAGGNGGQLILVYNELTNNGTISANAGTKGIGGTSVSGTPGSNGSDGTAGTIRYFQISL